MTSAARYPPERLVPHDPSWATRAAKLATTLRTGLGADWKVEHVGSTSVPGLAAKPVIDLALCQPPHDDLAEVAPRLRSMGWTEPVDVGDHRGMFMLVGSTRVAIAHLFSSEQWPSAHVRLFAQWLRTHDADRDAYQRLKLSLVAAGLWGTTYTSAKTDFVVGIVNRARAQQGLPPVHDL